MQHPPERRQSGARRPEREGGRDDRPEAEARGGAVEWGGWLVGIELRSGSWKITELTEPEYAI